MLIVHHCYTHEAKIVNFLVISASILISQGIVVLYRGFDRFLIQDNGINVLANDLCLELCQSCFGLEYSNE